MRRSIFICLLAILFLCWGCDKVTVPKDADHDEHPTVTITVKNFKTNYTWTCTTDQVLNVSDNTLLQFIVTGYNSTGGVKELDFTMPDVPKIITRSSTPATDNKVPKQLQIATENNMQVTNKYTGQGRTFTVTATAANFTTGATTVTLTIHVDYNPPSILFLKWDVDPVTHGDQGYINLGQSTHLNWQVNDCNGCKVVIRGFESTDKMSWIFPSINATNLPGSGSLLVHPTHRYSKYEFTAYSNYGQVVKTIEQEIHLPTPPPPQGMVFYFKVSSVGSCWTQSVVALNEADAENAVRQGNGTAVTIEAISQADFGNPAACGN